MSPREVAAVAMCSKSSDKTSARWKARGYIVVADKEYCCNASSDTASSSETVTYVGKETTQVCGKLVVNCLFE